MLGDKNFTKKPIKQVDDMEEARKAAERKGQQTINEIEGKKSFVGEKNVNGLMISMKWNDKLGRYFFSFPELPMDETNAGMYGRRMDIEDPNIAKSVFNYACELAEKESDPLIIFKEVASYTDELYHD